MIDSLKKWCTIEHALNILYTLNKLLVVIAGTYVVFWPPFTWVGTVSSAIMLVAGLVSIWAIWAKAYVVESVALWFVATGIAAFAGFQLEGLFEGDRTVAQASVAFMALILLAARGLSLYRLTQQMKNVERLIEENGS